MDDEPNYSFDDIENENENDEDEAENENENEDEDEDKNNNRKRYWNLVTYTAAATAGHYYHTYMDKTPCMNSNNTGANWMGELLRGHPERCRRIMRIEAHDFINLCSILENSYGLRTSTRMSVLEKVRIFIYTLAQGESNRLVQECFQHSGETISRTFHEVLASVCLLARELINPAGRQFRKIPTQILNDQRYMPHFKDCIGDIDGTHIDVVVPAHKQIVYIGQKGRPTQNVLAVCSFDLQFTYVLASFEGTAHDNRVLMHAIRTPNLNFPKPPHGKYYLVDAGYSQMPGYLGPYRGVRYHMPDFQQGQPPQGLKETFNKAHSSLRSCIERCFGIWKKRWDILRDMPSFPFKTQVKIVVTTMALHNYIRRTTISDEIFREVDMNPDSILEDDNSSEQVEESTRSSQQNDGLRNQIALSLLGSRN